MRIIVLVVTLGLSMVVAAKNVGAAKGASSATQLTPLKFEKKLEACSIDVEKRIVVKIEDIRYCKVIGYLRGESSGEAGPLVFTIFKEKSPYGHDCFAGLIFLTSKNVIKEDSAADCKYALEVENPAVEISEAFKDIKTGDIEFRFNSHGKECGNEGFLVVKGSKLIERNVTTECGH